MGGISVPLPRCSSHHSERWKKRGEDRSNQRMEDGNMRWDSFRSEHRIQICIQITQQVGICTLEDVGNGFLYYWIRIHLHVPFTWMYPYFQSPSSRGAARPEQTEQTGRPGRTRMDDIICCLGSSNLSWLLISMDPCLLTGFSLMIIVSIHAGQYRGIDCCVLFFFVLDAVR